MMLQGHFIDALLDPTQISPEYTGYKIWKYFRGITAPVFFTVSGFIFSFLLVKKPSERGIKNERIKKGLIRGVQLLFMGYLLRYSVVALFKWEVYVTFFQIDVLHCIGVSIWLLIAYYVLFFKYFENVYYLMLALTGLSVFLFFDAYQIIDFSGLPRFFQNYFVKTNGSVFALIPWIGYTVFGALLSGIYLKYCTISFFQLKLVLGMVLVATFLMFGMPYFLETLGNSFAIFKSMRKVVYLFTRLGDVLYIFSLAFCFNKYLTNKYMARIGKDTFSIYVIHYILLYGGITGFGLYGLYYHKLSILQVSLSVPLFILVCVFLSKKYNYFKNRLLNR